MALTDLPDNNHDNLWMARAIQLARRGRYTARPNPCVGCVLVNDSKPVGEGWHYRAGEAHAEVNAIQSAGEKARGATAYVTLEPCSHQGKTGPCTQALIEAGISRMVYGSKDPNPLVADKGIAALSMAGIRVDGPLLEEEVLALNPGFNSRMLRLRPWLRCKLAISLDARTAMANGASQWITSPPARSDVQRWRARSSAIVTGIGSVLQDNSRLTLRQEQLYLNNVADILSAPPLRVVLDSQLRTPLEAAILQADAPTLMITSRKSLADSIKVIRLQALGAHIMIEAVAVADDGGLDLQQVMTLLARQYHCNEVLLEAGVTLSTAFLQQGLIDELLIYQAPVLLGSRARPMFTLPFESMAEKLTLDIIDRRQVGVDQRIIARPQWKD